MAQFVILKITSELCVIVFIHKSFMLVCLTTERLEHKNGMRHGKKPCVFPASCRSWLRSNAPACEAAGSLKAPVTLALNLKLEKFVERRDNYIWKCQL